MIFEQGKYYRHHGGDNCMHIIGVVQTTMYGWCFVAESHQYGNLLPVGMDETSATNWYETTKEDWESGFTCLREDNHSGGTTLDSATS